MPNLNRFQIPPPRSWDEFEDLCLDLWSRLWADTNAQKNGRKGQAQHGVDVFGDDSSKSVPVGVQCKGKDTYTNAQVTQKELDAEILKAESFKPGIKHFILATTAPQDEAIQEYARLTSQERKSKGKFTLTVASWEWILSKLGDYPELIEKYYGEFGTVPKVTKSDNLTVANNSVLESGAFSPSVNASGGSVINQNLTVVQQALHNPTEDIAAELAFAKKNLNQHKAVEALHFLDEIHDRVIAKGDKELIFKLFTNKGAANLDLEKQDVAASLFIEAANYSTSRKALLNKSLAHVLQEKPNEAIQVADEVLKQDPENAKAFAYRLLAKSKNTPYETLLEEVPVSLRKDTDIAFAFASAAELSENNTEALEWSKVAYENDTDNAPEVKSYYAGKLIEPTANAIGFLGQLSDADKANVKFAIALFTEAWATYKDTDTKRYKTRYLYNRGLAKRLFGDMKGAIRDTEDAIALSPSDINYKFHLAQLVYENNDKDESIKLLTELLGSAEDSRARVMLSERYMEKEEFDTALKIIEPLLANGTKDYMQHSVYLIAISAYIQLGKNDEAKELIGRIKKNDTPLFTLIMEARLSKQTGDTDNAAALLKNALGSVNSSSPTDELSLLADALYGVELYQEASEAYEKFIDPEIFSPMSKRLLNSYYRAGRHKEALELSKLINDKGGSDEYTTEMESSIHEAIGDLASAEKVCLGFLEDHKDAHAVKVRLATVYYRQNKLTEIDKLIDTIPSDADLSLSETRQLAAMYSNRGNKDKALQLMYEARRKFYDDPDAHMGYLGLMLTEPTSEDDPILHTDTVAVDTVAMLKNKHGQQKHFIIEERSTGGSIRDSEYDIDSEQAKVLLGKKVSDEVQLGQEADWEIVGIKNKYLHALHETMSEYATLFPKSNSLMRFSFNEEKPEESVKELLSKVDSRTEYISEILSLYKDGKLTIGATAELAGSNIVDTMHALIEMPDIGLRASAGSIEELEDALSTIEEKPRLVVDLVALVILRITDTAPLLSKHFGKFIFAQSSIDELKERLRELNGRSKDGYASLGKQGQQYTNHKVTPERVAKNTEYIESLLSIIEKYGEVKPVTSALDINAKRRDELEDTLGTSSIDSALLANQAGSVLLTDDERLRGLATHELNVNGIWTQALLHWLAKDSLMTQDEYNAIATQLVEINYKHTRIDASTLVKSLAEAKNKIEAPYTSVVNQLTNADITEESLVMVASEFLYLLWSQSSPNKQKKLAAQYLLKQIAAYAQPDKRTLELLARVAEFRFKLNPVAAQEIVTLIDEAQSTASD
jgi:predicted Zn-dependent protease